MKLARIWLYYKIDNVVRHKFVHSEGSDEFGIYTVSPGPLLFSSNSGTDPLKKSQSYKASIKCWAIIGMTAKCH